MNEQEYDEETRGFFQKSSFNAKERLICSHLIECINAEPLDVVLHTAQAALLLDSETGQKLEINAEEVLSLYSVAQRLKTAGDSPVSIGRDPKDLQYPVNVETLDFDRDIKPWIGTYYRIFRSQNDEEIDQNLSPKAFYTVLFQLLNLAGYSKLVSDFMLYALPKIQIISGKLTEIISPQTYGELFKIMRSYREP